ncbi:MAG: glycosyltransferase family 2 protein [Propionibacteriaceae bacterium]
MTTLPTTTVSTETSSNTPLVSIIIPIYGVEDYIERAVQSLLAQTLTDFELLLVDDGSKDRSGEICDELAAADPRITVFHNPNGGAPIARNFAMDHARGTYYYFMDGDDWAEPTMLADMVELAQRTQAELVVCGFYIEQYYSDTEFVTEIKSQPSAVYEQQEFREQAWKLFENNLLNTPWNKLFLRSFVEEHGLRYPDHFWDDTPFSLSVVRRVHKVAVSSTPYYHFLRKRSESLTSKYRPTAYEMNEQQQTQMIEVYREWGLLDDPTNASFLARRYIDRFFVSLENVVSPENTATRAEKIATIHDMLQNPRLRAALPIAKYPSPHMRVMLAPLRAASGSAVYAMMTSVAAIKRRNVRVFGWLKAHR